jgi:acyl-coenzyme A synthetase/AMP-(fatty) acid ligase
VVAREGHQVKSRELLVSARAYIADFKLPSHWEFVEKLPRSPTGKILRRELRDAYWAHLDRRV